jgi:hypothetical protein
VSLERLRDLLRFALEPPASHLLALGAALCGAIAAAVLWPASPVAAGAILANLVGGGLLYLRRSNRAR